MMPTPHLPGKALRVAAKLSALAASDGRPHLLHGGTMLLLRA